MEKVRSVFVRFEILTSRRRSASLKLDCSNPIVVTNAIHRETERFLGVVGVRIVRCPTENRANDVFLESDRVSNRRVYIRRSKYRRERDQSSGDPCRLVDALWTKSKKADEDLEAFENTEREIEELRKRLNEARERASNLYVFGPDQDATEEELDELRSAVEGLLDTAKNFSGSTKARYQASQQLVPSDLAQHLTALELCAEATGQVMEEKQREQKRARTVRSDYLTDLDEVQAWIRQAELKVQDRSIEPGPLKEQLKQVQDELGAITDKLEQLTRNGRTIAENTRDETEKQLIESTVHNVTEQLNQVRSWLDERKQVVADTIDAWQRFLTLYEAVKAWTEEKRQFLVEPLKLGSLAQARQRLHEYSVRGERGDDRRIRGRRIFSRYLGGDGGTWLE